MLYYQTNSSVHRSEHAITVASPIIELWCPEIRGSHPFICWMHRNSTWYILFDIQFTYRFQESNVPRLCKCGFVTRGPNLVNACRICVYPDTCITTFSLVAACQILPKLNISTIPLPHPTINFPFFYEIFPSGRLRKKKKQLNTTCNRIIV